MGWTRCPSSCELGSDNCKCSVPQDYIDTYGAYYILEDTNVLYATAAHLADASDEMYMKVSFHWGTATSILHCTTLFASHFSFLFVLFCLFWL